MDKATIPTHRTGLAGRLGAWAQLARASNLPTCWSNALTGVVIGLQTGGERANGLHAGGVHGGQMPWGVWAMVAAVVSLFYIGGMALNDVFDTKSDAVHRPRRPIPSGRVSRSEAVFIVVVALAGGVALVAFIDRLTLMFSLALLLAIVLYNALHKKFASAAVLMGTCRALVYMIGASALGAAIDWPTLCVFAGTLGAYTVLVTVIARGETGSASPGATRLSCVVPLVPLAALLVFDLGALDVWAIPAMLIMILWLARGTSHLRATPSRGVPAILTWLSGMALMDAFFLVLLGYSSVALLACGCFLMTVLAHKRILGT